MTVTELKQKRAAALDKAKSIQTAAEAEGRELNDEQLTKIEAFVTEADGLQVQIQGLEKRAGVLSKLGEQHAALSQFEGANAGAVTGAGSVSIEARWEKDPRKGFAREQDFFSAVLRADTGGGVAENLECLRLRDPKFRAAVGSDEQSGFNDAYGGFLLPVGFSPELLSTPAEDDPLAGRTRKIPMDSLTIEIPARVDKDHSNSVSGGLRVYRRAEADTVAASRVEMELIRMTATSLMGLSYATEELLRFSPRSVAALLAAGFGDEFRAKLMEERIRGTGAGQYMGMLTSPCKITVAKEAAQTADTFLGENILKMRKRCWRYSNSIWLANHDCYDQLAQIHIAGTNGDVFLFNPARGEDVPDMLLGKPIYFTEYASTLGDEADLILVNPSEYLEATLQMLESEESIHVRFVNYERAFRFTMMNAGAPWWRSPLTPKHSTSTLSPIVTLQAR